MILNLINILNVNVAFCGPKLIIKTFPWTIWILDQLLILRYVRDTGNVGLIRMNFRVGIITCVCVCV